MNDWEEEDVKEYFKARGEEVRVLEVPSIDQRVIVAVNDREKRITVSLRGTKTLVKSYAQNLRLMTYGPKFGNNNISLGGSGSIDDTEQQQRRFPTIKFPMMTDARRKELFEEFPDQRKDASRVQNDRIGREERSEPVFERRVRRGFARVLRGSRLRVGCLALLYHHEGRTNVRRVRRLGAQNSG